MRPLVLILTILLLTSCIGDAVVTANYSIKNKTEQPLAVTSKANSSFGSKSNDTLILISPHSEKAVYVARYICSFGDCRPHKKKTTAF